MTKDISFIQLVEQMLANNMKMTEWQESVFNHMTDKGFFTYITRPSAIPGKPLEWGHITGYAPEAVVKDEAVELDKTFTLEYRDVTLPNITEEIEKKLLELAKQGAKFADIRLLCGNTYLEDWLYENYGKYERLPMYTEDKK